MNLWIWLLLSCLLAYAWKLLGYWSRPACSATRGCPGSPGP